MSRWLIGLPFALAVIVFALFTLAGRGQPPTLTIDKPGRLVGQASILEVSAEAPNAQFTTLTISVEQNGKSHGLFSLGGAEQATIAQQGPNRLRITRPFGKQTVPELEPGPARIVVSASRKSFLGLRTLSNQITKDVQVRLEPPHLAVVSTHHYVNHGGAEMVVYRVTPADVRSGVRVGTVEYPGFQAGGNDPSLAVAFFALLYDQDLNTPIVAFAQDEAGNESKVSFVDNAFEKPFKRSRIEIDDKFINRVVPEVLEHAPELKMSPPSGSGADLVPAFLKINGDLRRINTDEIAAFAAKTAPARSWSGPFVQLGNSKVEAAFADHRTYFYAGKEIDQQVHLGFDLAVTTHVPVVAANTGTVVNASWIGIYGNCIVIDHGMGVQSLYGHLMSFDVKVGDKVTRGQTIGRTDTTGLAGGDHLHFTMLVGGRMVNPVEWWDPHWINDRVERKLREAGSSTVTSSQ